MYGSCLHQNGCFLSRDGLKCLSRDVLEWTETWERWVNQRTGEIILDSLKFKNWSHFETHAGFENKTQVNLYIYDKVAVPPYFLARHHALVLELWYEYKRLYC